MTAKVGYLTVPANAGSVSVTTGFQPDLVYFSGCSSAGDNTEQAGQDRNPCIFLGAAGLDESNSMIQGSSSVATIPTFSSVYGDWRSGVDTGCIAAPAENLTSLWQQTSTLGSYGTPYAMAEGKDAGSFWLFRLDGNDLYVTRVLSDGYELSYSDPLYEDVTYGPFAKGSSGVNWKDYIQPAKETSGQILTWSTRRTVTIDGSPVTIGCWKFLDTSNGTLTSLDQTDADSGGNLDIYEATAPTLHSDGKIYFPYSYYAGVIPVENYGYGNLDPATSTLEFWQDGAGFWSVGRPVVENVDGYGYIAFYDEFGSSPRGVGVVRLNRTNGDFDIFSDNPTEQVVTEAISAIGEASDGKYYLIAWTKYLYSFDPGTSTLAQVMSFDDSEGFGLPGGFVFTEDGTDNICFFSGSSVRKYDVVLDETSISTAYNPGLGNVPSTKYPFLKISNDQIWCFGSNSAPWNARLVCFSFPPQDRYLYRADFLSFDANGFTVDFTHVAPSFKQDQTDSFRVAYLAFKSDTSDKNRLLQTDSSGVTTTIGYQMKHLIAWGARCQKRDGSSGNPHMEPWQHMYQEFSTVVIDGLNVENPGYMSTRGKAKQQTINPTSAGTYSWGEIPSGTGLGYIYTDATPEDGTVDQYDWEPVSWNTSTNVLTYGAVTGDEAHNTLYALHVEQAYLGQVNGSSSNEIIDFGSSMTAAITFGRHTGNAYGYDWTDGFSIGFQEGNGGDSSKQTLVVFRSSDVSSKTNFRTGASYSCGGLFDWSGTYGSILVDGEVLFLDPDNIAFSIDPDVIIIAFGYNPSFVPQIYRRR